MFDSSKIPSINSHKSDALFPLTLSVQHNHLLLNEGRPHVNNKDVSFLNTCRTGIRNYHGQITLVKERSSVSTQKSYPVHPLVFCGFHGENHVS